METHADFDVIEVVEDGGSYPALLGIGWDNDSMAVINFKKRFMTFKNEDVRVISPMDPQEGRWYIEPVRDEVGRSWEHAYNIFEDYIHPSIDGELRWHDASSTSSNSDDALENWQNRLHEVSFRKCGLITQSLRRVATETVEFPIYEGLPRLSEFFQEFEEKFFEPQRILAIDVTLKATLAWWWVKHKHMIHDWEQCHRLMMVHFGDLEVYHVGRYDGKNDPTSHLIECYNLWALQPKHEWVHAFVYTLEEMPRSWYVAAELRRTIIAWEELSICFT